MKMLAMIAAVMFVHSAFADGISIDPSKGIDAGKNKITNLAEPGLPGDAVTKGYTDSQITGHAANTSAHHTRYGNAEAVTAILAADGTDSGLDADKLDGYEADAFMLDSGYGGYISIPVGSLFLNNSSFSRWGVVLPANGTSSFTLNVAVPRDIDDPGNIHSTTLIMEIMVHWPGSAGACQAVIVPETFAHFLRVDFQDGYHNLAIDAASFPPFIGGNSSISQEYKLTGMAPGSPVLFEIIRNGDDPADNCGDVHIAGVAVRYPIQGRSNGFW